MQHSPTANRWGFDQSDIHIPETVDEALGTIEENLW